MQPISRFGIVFLCCVTFSGCFGTTETATLTPPPAATQTATDVVTSVDALKAAGAKLKQDGNGNVTEVDFRGTNIADDPLANLQGLKSVRSLLLSDTAVTDNGMEAVGKATSLQNLDLRGCEITNSGIAALTGLSNLKALRLSGKSGKTDVDDDAMDSVAKLTKLKVLALDFLFVGGAERLAKLEDLSELEELYLANTLVDDESLAVIAKFPKLKKLRAATNQVSDAGLAEIGKMSPLVELDLSENASISDEGLAHLAGMTQLRKLNLWKVPISDAGVSHLVGLTNLEWLNLDQSFVTDPGLVHLSGMTKLTFLHLGSTGITDEGLVHLEPLTALKDLKVTRTGVTAEGVEKLKQKLPNTEIQLKYIEGQ